MHVSPLISHYLSAGPGRTRNGLFIRIAKMFGPCKIRIMDGDKDSGESFRLSGCIVHFLRASHARHCTGLNVVEIRIRKLVWKVVH